jgi:CubicO group peptidase (beta-lactamase class C family)
MPDVMLDGVTSDPLAMGWMQGSPPPADKRILASQAGHMRFPMTRWAFSNMRQFCPTVRVGADGVQTATYPRALRDDLDGVLVTPIGSSLMTFAETLIENFTDGILVLHKGAVVYERWFGVTGPDTRHIAFSMTKSFIGTVAEMLIEEGMLDPAAPIGALIPELAASGFADATLRQVLDMTTGIDFNEDYTDPNSGIGAFSNALGLTPRPAGYTGATNMLEFLPTIGKVGAHGDGFTYRTANTVVLGWVLARATGKPVHHLLTQRLWAPLGMAADADMLVDSAGTPFSGGGLCLRLEDLARFGEAVRSGGHNAAGEQVIAAAAIARIFAGGDPERLAKATYPALPGASYRSQWWITHNPHGAISARGIHGQTLWIDPAAQMVVARFASHPIAANAANDPHSLPTWAALADHLARD